MTVLGKPGSWVIVQLGHPVEVSPKQIGLTVSTERDRIAGGEWKRQREGRGVDVVKGTERETDKSGRAKRSPMGKFTPAWGCQTKRQSLVGMWKKSICSQSCGRSGLEFYWQRFLTGLAENTHSTSTPQHSWHRNPFKWGVSGKEAREQTDQAPASLVFFS